MKIVLNTEQVVGGCCSNAYGGTCNSNCHGSWYDPSPYPNIVDILASYFEWVLSKMGISPCQLQYN